MTFILLDNTKDEGEGAWLFENLVDVIRADTSDEVDAAFAKLEQATKNGMFTAGFCSFELSYVLEPSLAALLPQQRNVPLIWFGVFKIREKLRAEQATAYLKNKAGDGIHVPTLLPEWSQDDYTQRFEKARDAISAGAIYQLNLTFKTSFECKRDPINLYLRLRQQQPVSFGAYIDAPEFKVLSLSPELFIRQNGNSIETRPMKGTAPRAPLPDMDVAAARNLAADSKSQAENLMIVDLMRNDIGRIARTGSVNVRNLFEVETYKTLHQMISTVSATLKPDIGMHELFKALFAPGSVVGAPKIQAMKIIRQLETTPRGVYCGAIGMMGQGEKVFNVAIRTAVLFPKNDGTYVV
jgi:para-aminobenzoate synthetase / 4-amino-4-deoxychorismate lyase